eukprot:TRINITY_DN8115_c0_g3_i2.p1 TRINITY_DN8115_c0_g3~~TRINITY_DN8115_c0_g3_i2.p1  ORF type:complete len:159 (+),score=55.33 TRINITY_DN8115_c0_g3_i2:293-769(+)
MREVEKMIQQRDRYKEQFQEATEVLANYIKELQKIRKYFMDIASENSREGKSEKAMALQAMRYKKLEDDNSRLRSLLKTQLENSENLRVETQHTIEALREEFDVLVKELISFRNKERENKAHPEGSKEEGSDDLAEKSVKKASSSQAKIKRSIPKLKL